MTSRSESPNAVCQHSDFYVAECIRRNGCHVHKHLDLTHAVEPVPDDRCADCGERPTDDSGLWWQLGNEIIAPRVCGACADERREVREPGIYDGISDIEYHTDRRSLSQSGAKLLLPPSTPAEFRWAMDHPQPPKKEYDFGHAAHTLVLGVGQELREIPAGVLASNGAASTKEAKAFIAQARKDGAVPLKADEIQTVHAMAAKQREHPLAAALFRVGEAEQSGYWIDPDTGVTLRFRTDWVTWLGGQCYCVDYKTSTTANPDKFRASVADYGYHQQDDWYRTGLRATGVSDDAIFLFVVQMKQPPYLVSVIQLSPDAVAVGAQLNRQAIDLYAWCTETDQWPGHDPEIHQIDLPAWAYRGDQ